MAAMAPPAAPATPSTSRQVGGKTCTEPLTQEVTFPLCSTPPEFYLHVDALPQGKKGAETPLAKKLAKNQLRAISTPNRYSSIYRIYTYANNCTAHYHGHLAL